MSQSPADRTTSAAQTQGTGVGREPHTLGTAGLTAGAEHVKSAASVDCGHEWVLIEERLDKHPTFELRSGLRRRVRRFYCKWCREVVEDADKEPADAR